MRQHSNKKVVYLRPKKKSFFSKIHMLPVLLLIGITVFLIYSYFYVNTYIVTKGVINESFFTDAIIIKNETPILSPTNGKLQLLVKSGERVRVGTPLFIITTDERQKELYDKEITEIEDKIRTLQEDSGSSSISLNLINKSIENITQKIKEATDSGEFDKVKSLKDELTRLTEEKQKKLEYNETNISLLKKQLKQLKDKLREIDIVTYASVAGIVSLNIDGFEDLLVADRVKDLTYDQLQVISKDTNNKDLPKNIKANQPVIKIIDNFAWYIAIKLENQMEEGRNYYIKIDDDENIKARLTNINDNGTIGFFLIDAGLDRLLDSRKARVEVITGSYTGNIIPTTALFLNEGKEGVYILERGKRRFKPIEIVAQNENNMIVNGLKPGDKILLQ
mgnify:FL=1